MPIEDDADTRSDILRLSVPRWMSKGDRAPRKLRPTTHLQPMTLVFHSDQFETFSRALVRDLRVGRAVENDIIWVDPSVSRRHCRLLRVGREVWLEDVNSRNGTWVNGVLVHHCQLFGGDRVTVGKLEFQVFVITSE